MLGQHQGIQTLRLCRPPQTVVPATGEIAKLGLSCKLIYQAKCLNYRFSPNLIGAGLHEAV